MLFLLGKNGALFKLGQPPCYHGDLTSHPADLQRNVCGGGGTQPPQVLFEGAQNTSRPQILSTEKIYYSRGTSRLDGVRGRGCLWV